MYLEHILHHILHHIQHYCMYIKSKKMSALLHYRSKVLVEMISNDLNCEYHSAALNQSLYHRGTQNFTTKLLFGTYILSITQSICVCVAIYVSGSKDLILITFHTPYSIQAWIKIYNISYSKKKKSFNR